MNIRPEYQKHLTDKGLFLLDQLPENIQPIAIQNILNSEHTAFLTQVKNAHAAIKLNVHACINNRYFIHSIYSKRNKLKCPKYCRTTSLPTCANLKRMVLTIIIIHFNFRLFGLVLIKNNTERADGYDIEKYLILSKAEQIQSLP